MKLDWSIVVGNGGGEGCVGGFGGGISDHNHPLMSFNEPNR